MSEVKRYNAYAEGLTVHFELDSEGAWVAADELEAQCLRADTAEAELLKFDEGMRALACSLGAGGYNAETLTVDQLVGKVHWGIDNLLEVNERRIAAAEQRIARMEAALKYYADKDHFSMDDGMNWDSCSGEPSNILWHEEQPWFIEDGSIARAALNPNPEAESHGS